MTGSAFSCDTAVLQGFYLGNWQTPQRLPALVSRLDAKGLQSIAKVLTILHHVHGSKYTHNVGTADLDAGSHRCYLHLQTELLQEQMGCQCLVPVPPHQAQQVHFAIFPQP